jgi:hypothetical protein
VIALSPASTAGEAAVAPLRPARRARRATVAVLILAAATLAAYLAVWAQLSRADQTGSDYSTFHVAALTWRGGHGAQLYDQPAEIRLHESLVPPGYHVDLPFISPPTTALLTAPLTVLDLGAAFRLAAVTQLALAAAAVAVALRAAPRRPTQTALERLATGAVALAGVGTLVTLLMGQWDGLCTLGLALAYAAWRRERPGLAGLALALTIAPTKPHIALGLAAFLLATRQPRALAGAAAGVAVTFAAGLLVAGLQGWGDWLGSLSLSSSHSPLQSLLGFTGFFGSWLGDTTAARTLATIATVAAVAACALLGDRYRRDRDALEPALAGAAALSLVAAPHLLMHDLVLLAPAAAWTLQWAATRSSQTHLRGLAAWLLLNLAALLDLGNSASAPPGRLVPLALALLGVVALRATAPPRAAAAYSGSGSGVGGLVDQS